MKNEKIQGLIAAPFTPFQSGGSLQLETIDTYARWLSDNGVSGAFICGTTGEGLSLTTAERMQVAQRWVAAAPAELRVLVHVGHNSLPDCQELAAHAQSIGAAGFACMAPSFFQADGVEGLVQWCEQVASAAPSLPFYYYHIPSMARVSVKVEDFLRAAADRIPNLAGVKFTFEDLEDFENCQRLDGGRFDMLFGRDEILLSALQLGARGAVGSTYNFAAPLYQAVIAAYDQGDVTRATELQAIASGMISEFLQSTAHPLAAFKWLMSRVGVDCGPVRLPLSNPTQEQIARLEARLQASGIYEWIKAKPSAAAQA